MSGILAADETSYNLVMPDSAESIGTATMQPDGVIILYLRAESPGGIIGDGQIRYSPAHPKYQEVLLHLGGLHPGEIKPVPPWPDEK